MKRSQDCERLMLGFGERLRNARIVAEYENAGDFASDLKIDDQRYRKYERGESMPPLDVLEGISKKTRKSLDWLLLGKQSKRSAE